MRPIFCALFLYIALRPSYSLEDYHPLYPSANFLHPLVMSSHLDDFPSPLLNPNEYSLENLYSFSSYKPQEKGTFSLLPLDSRYPHGLGLLIPQENFNLSSHTPEILEESQPPLMPSQQKEITNSQIKNAQNMSFLEYKFVEGPNDPSELYHQQALSRLTKNTWYIAYSAPLFNSRNDTNMSEEEIMRQYTYDWQLTERRNFKTNPIIPPNQHIN